MNTIELNNTGLMKADFARLKLTLSCASKDPTRAVINKVQVETCDDGIVIVATDGQRLRTDRFNLEAEPGLYDIKVNAGKSIYLVKSDEEMCFPNYRQVIPDCTEDKAYALNGCGINFVIWASASLGCYLRPKLIALDDEEAFTLYIQKAYPGTSGVLLQNPCTTLVIMPYNIGQELKDQLDAINVEQFNKAMTDQQAVAA